MMFVLDPNENDARMPGLSIGVSCLGEGPPGSACIRPVTKKSPGALFWSAPGDGY